MQRGGRSSHQTPSREVDQGQDSISDTDTSTQLQKLVNESVLHGGLTAGPEGQIYPVAHPNLSSSGIEGTIEVPTSVHALQVSGQQLQVVAPELISVADYLAHSAATRSVGASQRQHISPARSSLDQRGELGQFNVNPSRNAFSLAFPGTAGYRPPSGSPVIESIVFQPLSAPSQQLIGTAHHLAQGVSGRKLETVKKCPRNATGGPSSGSPYSGQGHSTTPLSFPFSPSQKNPLQSSPFKPIKSIMSVATNQPPTEVVELRRKTLQEKRKTLKEVQNSYVDKLTELFFLQQNHNMMDYVVWKKKQPDPQLASYLKSRQLEERTQDQNINKEIKVTPSSSSNVPPSTPMAISTQLPQEVAAQLKKRSDGSGEGGKGQQGLGGSSIVSASESRKRTSSQAGLDVAGEEPSVKLSLGGSEVSTKSETSLTAPSRTLPSITVIPAASALDIKSGSEEAPLVTKVAADASDVKGSSDLASPLRRNIIGPSALGQLQSKALVKSPLPPGLARERQGTRQGALSAVYDYTIGSQEMIVERAKQEAQVMQRIAELRRDGLWCAKRLPRVQEPPRHKSHWDYLLEEMQWLAADFAQERRWKKNAARKLARAVAKYHQEQEAREMKAGREEVMKLKRIAGNIAKEIKAFWANIEKVVQYKQQSRLDEQRKKALDLQLDYIVGQTEKYSSWLTEGLNTSTAGSSAQGSSVSSPRSDRAADDMEFKPQGDESDDEETIDVEEKQAAKAGEESGVSEIELLQRESELPIEELLTSLQAAQKEEEKRSSGVKVEEETTKEKEEDKPGASLEEVTGPESKISESKDDKDFELSADEEEQVDDDEKTLEEQEEAEGTLDHKTELNDLAADGEIPIEELLKQYDGAHAEDFDFSDVDDEDDESEEEDSSQDSSQDSSSEEEEVDEEDQDQDELKDVGMEYLINPEKENEVLAEKASQGTSDDASPNMEITDIAAAAQSLQPTGYTLSDTQVKTKVPFLLRHTLREYQHIGLDWLVTMLEKKLNGILADEMGLGKTIQTIALLAHLACEEACWGPHLIVVPTSVMLNWEMEFKKWCPGFKILTYYGSQKERKLKRTGWTKSNAFHVCITSYKLVIQDHQSFRRKKWKYLVLDEAQNIKNFKSQRWQTLLNFSSQRRLLLTGTPLQNNLMELWSLMHFLMPHVFQSHREFKEWFSNPLGGMIEGTQEYNEGIIRRLHKVLRPFLLRRLKSQVEKQLPQKYEHVIRCRLSKRQRFLYDDFMAQRKTKETLTTGHFMSVINVLMQLRKVCNHPDLFEERQIVSPYIMAGLLYYTASLVHRIMEYNPLKEVSLQALNLCIADLEISLPAYAAHRTCQLQTPRKLIEEIDSAPEPPTRPPRVKVKPGKLYPSPMALQAQKEARASPSLVNRPSDRASPSALHTHGRGSPSIVRVASPNSKAMPGTPGLTQVLVRSNSGVSLQTRAPTPPQGTAVGTSQILQAHSRPGTPPVTLTAISNPRSPGTLTLVSQNPQPVPSGTPLQQLPGYTGTITGNVASQLGQRRVLLQQQQVSGVGTNGRAQLITTQPITVQLQSGSSTTTQSGQRLLAGQIRQLPQGGIVQIIQTSGGQQIIRPAVQLTTQANLVNAQRTANSQTQVVHRAGTPQMVLSHTAAQLQAAQQLHQSIQRQLTAQGVSPSQAQAVASQLSKVTAAQSPLQLQQRQILLQQQQQPQQVVINAKGASVHTTPATQTVTCASTTSRPSSPSITIVQAARSVNASSPTLATVKVSSPASKTVVAVSSASADRTINSASPTPKVVRASSPSVKTSIASVSPKVQTVKEESKESKELKEAAEKLKKAERKRKSSPLYLESLDKACADERKASLSRLATFNQQRCSAKPVYGQDLFTAVSLYHTSKPAGKRRPFSNGVGNIHCYHALIGDALRRVEAAYKKTRNLRHVLHTPLDYLDEVQQIIERYAFVVPPVTAPLISMHTSHTPPSVLNQERILIDTLSTQLKPRSRCLHPIENRMRMDIPELRLIQYDCGKLQTMDVLLRKLKAEGSRVLIFTQMTKMLDIFERFLNYHGHIYLRLDGTTKVEQRQIMMERFNKDPRIFCFILSTRSGGVGVNLTGANAVIFYDSDWNPTMDAQAQDRCHRIGQTRDVHIYRLISEMSIEENILKKSNQKRLLIDVSIEGGNFTTAFFKKHTLKDIFDVSKDAGSLQDLVQVQKAPVEQPKESPPSEQEAKAAKPLSQTELEKALARAEDDTDVKAASRAHAEQDAELAEFDESIPYDGEEGKGNDETSKLETELAQLNNQLTPIERYAVVYLEDTLEPITAEQLKEAEEQVETAKRDWELGRLQALKEQEEREAELEEEEVLYTYSREDSENQVHKSSKNAKRKEKSKGAGEKGARDTRLSRRESREKGHRTNESREGSRTIGSRTSSRAGSPPPVERQTRRIRSRASSGTSGTEGDLSRRTRSRTSSESGSERLPSPRGVDRASRMAERENRRDTPRRDTSQLDTPRPVGRRPVGRPRIRSADCAKSPERILPKRKTSGSDTGGVESRGVALRKARSPDGGSVFSNGDRLRSGRSHRRSVSVSEGSKVSGNLAPVVETVKTSSVRTDVDLESSNHVIGKSQDRLHTENRKNEEDHDQSAPIDAEKRTRNIFDIVDTMRIKDRIKDAIGPASESRIGVGNVLEKINTRNLFADLAKKFKKKNVPEKSSPIPEEDGGSRSNSATASINHHPVTNSANEIESSTITEGKGEQEFVNTNDTETKMLRDSQDNESIAVETTQDVLSLPKSPSPQHEVVKEELPVTITQGDTVGNRDEDDIVDVVEPERTPHSSDITSLSTEASETITDTVEIESTEAKSENLIVQEITDSVEIESTEAKSENLIVQEITNSVEIESMEARSENLNVQEITNSVEIESTEARCEMDQEITESVEVTESMEARSENLMDQDITESVETTESMETRSENLMDEEITGSVDMTESMEAKSENLMDQEITDSVEINEPMEARSENLMDQEMSNIQTISPTPAPLVQSKDDDTLDASSSLDLENENKQAIDIEVVVDDSLKSNEGGLNEKEIKPLVEEEDIQSDTGKDQTSPSENEIPENTSRHANASYDLATQNVPEEERLDLAPDVSIVPSHITEQAPESHKEIEPVEEEKSMPILSEEPHLVSANTEKVELPQVVEKMPVITVSNPDIPMVDSSPAAVPVLDRIDANSSVLLAACTSVGNIEINNKADTQDKQSVESAMETDTVMEIEGVVVEKEHGHETVKQSTESKQLESEDGQEVEQNKEDIEQGSTSEDDMQNVEIVGEEVPKLDLSEVNNDDIDEDDQNKNTADEKGSEQDVGGSSGQGEVDEDFDTESVQLTLPPKPTRRVREILNLTLPGEKPLNLDIDSPSARTRSRNTSDTVRTRSRIKPSSSPNIGSVFTPLRASPRSGGKGSTKKAAESPSSVIGAKRSPRQGSSDSGVQLRLKRTLRSSDVS